MSQTLIIPRTRQNDAPICTVGNIISSTGVEPLRSLRGSRVVTTATIISQAPLGAVKSTTARSRGLTAIQRVVLFKFTFASSYTRQIASSGPEDERHGQHLRPYAFQDYLETSA